MLEETGVDILEASRDELAELAGDDAEPDDDWAGLVDTLQGKLVEPKLIQPTFIVDLPLDIWPLVKPVPEHPELLGEAFDGIVAGMEIIGGGTDINDPVEQRERFVDQRERQESGSRGGRPIRARRRVRAGARIRDAAGERLRASASTA